MSFNIFLPFFFFGFDNIYVGSGFFSLSCYGDCILFFFLFVYTCILYLCKCNFVIEFVFFVFLFNYP